MIAFAWTALILWPVAALYFFNKYSLPVALCATILGGYLLLPNGLGFDLKLLPALDKDSITALAALVGASIALAKPNVQNLTLPGWVPRSPTAVLLLLMLIVGAFGSFVTNQDPLFYGWRYIPGMKIYDIFSNLLGTFMMLMPLFLGRRLLASFEAQKVLLIAMAISALAYTVPILWEIRMSPQLHTQIYGYFHSSFNQQVRAGGFRAVVFLNHGLSVSIFLTLAVIAAIGLMKGNIRNKSRKWLLAAVWLAFVLSISKSLGPAILAVIFGAVALFMTTRVQIIFAACVAGTVLAYPLLRSADLVPIERVMELAMSVDEERADSLNVRIINEEALLEKARERIVFGWGGWGRNRIYDENGNDRSLTDGAWTILMGQGGWFRYIPLFGLLALPIIGLCLVRRDRIDVVCGALILMLAAKLANAIPNNGLDPTTWLIAGALLGRLEASAQVLARDAEKPLLRTVENDLVPIQDTPLKRRAQRSSNTHDVSRPKVDPLSAQSVQNRRNYTRFGSKGIRSKQE